MTALMLATREGDPTAIKALIDAGARIDHTGEVRSGDLTVVSITWLR